MAARLSQEAVQLAAEPSSAAVRLSQHAVQLAAVPSTTALRLSQSAILVAITDPQGQRPFEEHGFTLSADVWN